MLPVLPLRDRAPEVAAYQDSRQYLLEPIFLICCLTSEASICLAPYSGCCCFFRKGDKRNVKWIECLLFSPQLINIQITTLLLISFHCKFRYAYFVISMNVIIFKALRLLNIKHFPLL